MAHVTQQQKITDSAHSRNFYNSVVARQLWLTGSYYWPLCVSKIEKKQKTEHNKWPNIFR